MGVSNSRRLMGVLALVAGIFLIGSLAPVQAASGCHAESLDSEKFVDVESVSAAHLTVSVTVASGKKLPGLSSDSVRDGVLVENTRLELELPEAPSGPHKLTEDVEGEDNAGARFELRKFTVVDVTYPKIPNQHYVVEFPKGTAVTQDPATGKFKTVAKANVVARPPENRQLTVKVSPKTSLRRLPRNRLGTNQPRLPTCPETTNSPTTASQSAQGH